MRIQLSHACPFNLEHTLSCGQVFRWNKKSEWWYGVANKNVLKIRQIGDMLEFDNVDEKFVKDYFGLSDNLPEILAKIGKDKHIKCAIETLKGLRIIRQDPWECLISYICATYKNISAIKQTLGKVAKKFGEKICLDCYDFYTFPTAEKLSNAKIEELADCGLGYRAKYVRETAKMVRENSFELENLRWMPYERAKRELLKFTGVGLKVADCTLLFSLGKFEAFPVDVWISRVILRHYSNHFSNDFIKKISAKDSLTNMEYAKLSSFGRMYFGEYAGYAQEYLYHYERTRG